MSLGGETYPGLPPPPDKTLTVNAMAVNVECYTALLLQIGTVS